MTDPDVPAVPALPDRAPSFRWRHFAVRLLFVAILLAVAGALPGGRGAPEKFRNREGDIARERVVAPYEFRVEKDEATLRREQEQAAAAVGPVFVVDPRVSSDMLNRFELFREKALAVVMDPNLPPEEITQRLRGLGVPLGQESAEALAGFQATLGLVQKDELIVDATQRVPHEALLKLRSLRSLEAARRGRSETLYPPMARMLLMLLFIAVFTTYLRVELPAVYRNNSILAVFTLLTVLVMAMAELQVGILGLSEFTVPLALAPLVVATTLEKRPALMFTLMLAVVVAVVGEMRAPFVPVAVMGGVTAVYSVSRLRHRWHFARAFVTIALANLAAILAWDLARVSSTQALMRDAMWGGASAFVSVALAFLLP